MHVSILSALRPLSIQASKVSHTAEPSFICVVRQSISQCFFTKTIILRCTHHTNRQHSSSTPRPQPLAGSTIAAMFLLLIKQGVACGGCCRPACVFYNVFRRRVGKGGVLYFCFSFYLGCDDGGRTFVFWSVRISENSVFLMFQVLTTMSRGAVAFSGARYLSSVAGVLGVLVCLCLFVSTAENLYFTMMIGTTVRHYLLPRVQVIVHCTIDGLIDCTRSAFHTPHDISGNLVVGYIDAV